jgi:5-formyltetrahydrofolate cyclo-ligase
MANTDKNTLRKDFLKKRSLILPEKRKISEKKILENILSYDLFRNCRYILCYVSVRGECDTKNLINKAFSLGKKVAVPKCTADGIMQFYLIDSLNQLVDGKYNIPEPPETLCLLDDDFFAENQDILCIVPALCFDKSGYRVGYGKGYYDRFLAKYENISSIGLCFEEFVVENVPRDCFDRHVDVLITEEKCYTNRN